MNSGGHPNYGRYAQGNHGGMNHVAAGGGHHGVNRGVGGPNGLNHGLGSNGLQGNRPNLNSSFNRGNTVGSINHIRNINQTAFHSGGGRGGTGNNGYHHGHNGYNHNWMHGRWGGYGRGGYGGYGYGRGYGGYGGYGLGGYGLGGFGYGLGTGLGFGLGYGLLGLGGLGFGGLGYGLGYGGWGYGLGGFGLGYGGWGYGGYGLGYGGLGLGYGLGYGGWGLGGYGISPWLYGPSLYNWGYSNYYNPYLYSVYSQPVIYDYSQPINTQGAASVPPNDTAISNFDNARVAFKSGDYNKALDLTDLAIRDMPNDAALHEFRALSLFALGRFNEAAVTLHSVLAVGPGWDWATLAGLYPNVTEYTNQLRSLEGYISQNSQSAPARFVLAYHYLTENHPEAAAKQLQQVVMLQPKDNLSAQLLQQLQPNKAPSNAPTASAPAPGNQPTVDNTPIIGPVVAGKEGRLDGSWTANPDGETAITLSFLGADRFSWVVSHKGKDQPKLEGNKTFGRNILTLAQNQGPALVGNLTWQDETHFNFKVPGANPSDPGLSFTKNP
jgi:tetratricopeptide (TPR) repeat protein